jgi:hypothetical protein
MMSMDLLYGAIIYWCISLLAEHDFHKLLLKHGAQICVQVEQKVAYDQNFITSQLTSDEAQ